MTDKAVFLCSHFSSLSFLFEVNAQQQQDREADTPIDHESSDAIEQQLAVQQQTDNQDQQPAAIPNGAATNPASLGQLNTMLVSMLQQSAQQGQAGQNPMPNTDSLLAQIIAAANGANFQNSQHVPGAGTNLPSGQQGQQNLAGGFMDQAVGSQTPVNAGVQSLQQQLLIIQQQLGGGFAPPQQNVPPYQPMQQPQHHQGQMGSQQIQQFAPAQYQQQYPFMGHMGQGFNPALFHNYGAFGPFGQFGGNNSLEPSTGFMNQVQMPNTSIQGFDGLGTPYQGAFPLQQQSVGQSETPPNNKKMEKSKAAATLKSKSEEEQGSERLDRGKKVDPTKRSAKSFPEKLMQAMMMVADDDIVAWLPDGKSFVVVDPDRICAEVLAKVFKESKYPSFVRKLHRYVLE